MSHFGLSQVVIEGDQELGKAYIPAALKVLSRLQSRLKDGLAESGGAQRRLSDDVHCYVRVAMGVNVVRIIAGSGVSERAAGYNLVLPDFLSGVVTDGRIAKDSTGRTPELQKFLPTRECAIAFGLDTGEQKSRRLAVEPHERHKPQKELKFTPSQYYVLRPSLYSGTMRKLVQFLLGYGRLAEKSRYGKSYVTVTEEESQQPEPTDFEKAVSENGLQVSYDYRFAQTHGLVKGQDGKWWLVEIGIVRGCSAMPLPLNERTTTPEFRALIVEMGDAAALKVLDTFGGFPTGEGFPSGEEYKALVRAGYIVQMDKPERFYNEYTFYTPEIGWAFSESGKEAHLTGWRFEDSDGVQRGGHYNYAFNFPSIPEIDAAQNASQLIGALANFQSMPGWKAAAFKINRMSKSQVDGFIRGLNGSGGAAQVWKEVDELEMGPIVAAQGTLSKVSDGMLYNPGIKTDQQIKFPDPYLGYLLSHQFTPLRPEGVPPDYDSIVCDTTMHVFFAGEELKTLKYFKGPVSGYASSSSSFEPCMYIGSWSSESSSGVRGVGRAYYTNEIDGRKERTENYSRTDLSGKSSGYTGYSISDDPTDPRYGVCSRSKRFRMRQVTEEKTGTIYFSAAIIPFYDREAMYIAEAEFVGGYKRTVTHSYRYLGDPNVGFYFRALWGGEIKETKECGAKQFRRIFKLPEPVSGGCADIANGGAWLSICQIVETPTTAPEPKPPAPTETKRGPYTNLTVHLITGTESGTFIADKQENDGGPLSTPSVGAWFTQSPDLETGLTQYMEVLTNCLGDTHALRYSKTPLGPYEFRGAAEYEDKMGCFIGVV